LIVFPNAKINLGLHIVRRRPDGFHDIETVFYPAPLKDALEAVHAPAGQPGISLQVHGLPVDGPPEANLCVKAWQLLKKDFPDLPATQAHLLKHIPMGGGLGGGSADGAFMLRLLNAKFRLELSNEQLIEYAAQLGSDCPFFIINQPCYATGRGEILQPLALDLSGWWLVLATPGIHVNTGWAFSQLNPAIFERPRPRLPELLLQPVAAWKDQLVNDFESPVFEKYPVLKALRDRLYLEGAAYAALSGSGSTVYGLFEKNKPPAAALAAGFGVMNL
jgi:4-diphosphocytidyl-2-C-methyl-D-erythritol kinase